MKISLNWLRDYVVLDAPVEEITRALTFLGFEVEGVATTGAPKLENVVVGEVLTRTQHPNADRLSVCTVDVGPAGGVKTIVCGATNYKAGDRVLVALPGAVLPGNFAIKLSKIRGQASEGMMCSGKELGIGGDDAGLLILTERPAIGLPINSVLPPGDTVIDIEVTPNRPDCLSHLGIARELAAGFGKVLIYPKNVGPVGDRADRRSDVAGVQPGQRPGLQPELQVRVDSTEDCPLYRAYVVNGVKIGPSPGWLQERLRSVGLRPVNNVVDVTNYVLLEYGQPLHAFDASKLAGNQIIVRRASDGEKLTTLDGKERTLSSRMLVIADAARPVVIAGVMGGENSGVEATTTDLVLECAIFKPSTVRWTSKRLGLSSDSSYRYERGVDPHSAGEAAARALELILATAGGQVAGEPVAVGGDVPWQREIALATSFVTERLGFVLPEEAMKNALEALELRVTRTEAAASGGGHLWTVAIPSWRGDLDRPIDLVEEILRIHGTERIPPAVVQAPGLAAEDDPVVVFNRRATAYLVGHDFHECVNPTLRSGKEMATWVSEAAAQELALANPLVADESHLRPTLITGLLDALKLNQSRGVAVSRLAEVGRIFVEHNGNNFECAAAGFIIAEDPERRWKQREAADFYTVKHHVESLAAAAGIDLANQTLTPVVGSYFGWQPGHAAAAGDMADGWSVRFGLLNPGMIRAAGIERKVYAGILQILPGRLKAGAGRRRFAEFSLFPAALRDLALVVETKTEAATVEQTLAKIARAAAGSAFALENIAIFDVYEGPEMPAGRKSLAFSLVFRAPDRTLTDEEVNAAFAKIQDEVLKTTPYQIRK